MPPHERLLIKLGAVRMNNQRHRVYILHGVRFSLHQGTNRSWFEQRQVMSKLKQMAKHGLIEGE